MLARGERDAGTVIVVLNPAGKGARAYERMPNPDGTRAWALAKAEQRNQPDTLQDWLERRQAQDPDLWIIELDIPCGERFIGLPASSV